MSRLTKGPGSNPTLQQVARRAGVSIATASRVVTGAVPVSPDRRARVEEAIAELGYVPDERARDLRRATTTRTVGIMLPSLADPLAAEVFQRLHRALRREGATVMLHESHDSRDGERLAVDALLRAHARAAIVSAPHGLGVDSTHLLRRRDVRVVYFGDRPADVSQMSVGVDDHGGSRRLTEHLLKLGHRRIGYLAGRVDGSAGADRRDGYVSALRTAGIAADLQLIAGQTTTAAAGHAAAGELLRLRERPTAILAAHPLLAAGALLAIRERGLRVPDEVSLASFFESDHIRYVSPPITCLDGIGEGTARAVLAALDHREPGRVDVPLTLAVRPSTGPPRVSR
jgi:LacI family transcriptional regulator